MYPRRRRSGGPIRWLAGFIIIAAAVVAFTLFQGGRSPARLNGPIPTNTRSAATALQPSSVPSTLTATQAVTVQPIAYRIFSAKANLSAVITEVYFAKDDNWDLSHLSDAAGHLEGTPEFGQSGNYVLAGHVELKDGRAGPFAQLHLLNKGDLLTIVSNSANAPVVMEYAVTEIKKTNPQDIDQIRNHGFEELTLVTCDDWDARTLTYNTRLIVHARPVAVVKPTRS